MIQDSLNNYRRYLPLHPIFRDAFEVLEGLTRTLRKVDSADEAGILFGKQEILPERLWLIVEKAVGRGMENAPLESHRRMIDVQLVLQGVERIGWRAHAQCQSVSEPYSVERDIEFFGDKPTTWQDLLPGQFCVFFPEDAHAPLAGTAPVIKAIAKVAVESVPPGLFRAHSEI